MGKYDNMFEKSTDMGKICLAVANELAEANRLTRLKMLQYHDKRFRWSVEDAEDRV